jgi:hypothetical protein
MLTFAVQMLQELSMLRELDLKVPAGHATHPSDEFLMKPTLHEKMHWVVFGTYALLDGIVLMQLAHAESPSYGAYVPYSQAMHVVEIEYVPFRHCEQVLLPSLLYKPASHPKHSVDWG